MMTASVASKSVKSARGMRLIHITPISVYALLLLIPESRVAASEGQKEMEKLRRLNDDYSSPCCSRGLDKCVCWLLDVCGYELKIKDHYELAAAIRHPNSQHTASTPS